MAALAPHRDPWTCHPGSEVCAGAAEGPASRGVEKNKMSARVSYGGIPEVGTAVG